MHESGRVTNGGRKRRQRRKKAMSTRDGGDLVGEMVDIVCEGQMLWPMVEEEQSDRLIILVEEEKEWKQIKELGEMRAKFGPAWEVKLQHLLNGVKGTFYDRLGVSEDASVEQIRKGFQRKSIIYHPDKYPTFPCIMSVLFQLINEAKETLVDEELRQKYDEYLRQQRGQDGRGGWNNVDGGTGCQNENNGWAGNGGQVEPAVPCSRRQLGRLAADSRPAWYGMMHSSRYNAQEPSKSCVSQESLEASLWSGKTNDISSKC